MTARSSFRPVILSRAASRIVFRRASSRASDCNCNNFSTVAVNSVSRFVMESNAWRTKLNVSSIEDEGVMWLMGFSIGAAPFDFNECT